MVDSKEGPARRGGRAHLVREEHCPPIYGGLPGGARRFRAVSRGHLPCIVVDDPMPGLGVASRCLGPTTTTDLGSSRECKSTWMTIGFRARNW